MIDITNVMQCDKEWSDFVYDILENGGSLWVIERTDTNQFMIGDVNFNYKTFHDAPFEIAYKWRNEFPSLTKAEYGLYANFDVRDLYPTKELAEKYAPKEIKEGGCKHCGNGSVNIPIRLVEHEFIPIPNKINIEPKC